jgi:uncharacterized protein YjbI with pentapeptide repeats
MFDPVSIIVGSIAGVAGALGGRLLAKQMLHLKKYNTTNATELLNIKKTEEWNEVRIAYPNWIPYLHGINLSDSYLPEVNFREANLAGANLSRTVLDDGDFTSAYLASINLYQTSLVRANFMCADLIEANLDGSSLISADLTNCNLRGASLVRANLQEAILTGANLENAILDESSLVKANLTNCNLRGASLVGANLQDTILSRAKLEEANLTDANLNGCSYSDVRDYNLNVESSISLHHCTSTSLEQNTQKELITKIKENPHLITQISSSSFEELVAELFIRSGFEVDRTPKNRDYGYDLKISHSDPAVGKRIFLVECKKYGSGRPVGISPVRSLYAMTVSSQAEKGIIVTTNILSDVAQDFASRVKNIITIEKDDLMKWIEYPNAAPKELMS